MTPPGRRPRRATSTALVAVAASIALTVAACGDDDEPSADSASEISAPGDAATTDGGGDTDDTSVATTGETAGETTPFDTEPPTDATSETTGGTDTGGTDTGGGTEEDAWRDQMNVLCDASREGSASIEPPETVGDLGRAVGELIEVGDTLVEGARELDAPASVRSDVDELIALWEEKREQLEELPGQFEDAGYSADEALDDISDDEAQDVAGEALDQGELQEKSQDLDIRCFGNA